MSIESGGDTSEPVVPLKKVQRTREEFSPIVHKEFPEMGSSRAKLRVRLLQYQHPNFGISEPKLDIRKYLQDHKNKDGSEYTGFTREGISLNWDDVNAMFELIPQIIELMDSIEGSKKA